MVPLAAGAVVLVRFPFSDLSQTKLRPAVVLAHSGKDDWILCQVTSNPYRDASAVEIDNSSFISGSLNVTSFARPGKLFTADASLVHSTVGSLKPTPFHQIVEALVAIVRPKRS